MSIFLSVSLYLCLFIYISVSISPYNSVTDASALDAIRRYRTAFTHVKMYTSLSLSLYHYLCLYIFISISLSLYLCLSISVSISLIKSLTDASALDTIRRYKTVFTREQIYISVSISLSLSLYLCLFIYISVSISPYNSVTDASALDAIRRYRTAFTREQIGKLEKEFIKENYISR